MWDLIVSVPDHCLSFYFDEPVHGPYMLDGNTQVWPGIYNQYVHSRSSLSPLQPHMTDIVAIQKPA